jgi:hypothetical protein
MPGNELSDLLLWLHAEDFEIETDLQIKFLQRNRNVYINEKKEAHPLRAAYLLPDFPESGPSDELVWCKIPVMC